MKTKIRNNYFLALLSIILIITSCSKNKMGVPADLSNVENLVATSSWAVVKTPYTAFRDKPSLDSKITQHSRRGDSFEIVGKSIQLQDKKQIIWYQFDQGWISEEDLSIYSNRLQAEYAASLLIEQN